MATISLCMIVKNEEDILKRCLDSLDGLYDEAIIVDTGSTDSTKEIAKEYTDKVFDFQWIDDFSAARNYAMSKATCDYVYMADADEVIDEENRKKFLVLKEALDKDVEIVQMAYVNQLENGSVYNFDRELRAKLYKRCRSFTFVDPIHEVVRENPVVYDSDIDIIHMQQINHSGRDLKTFRKAIERDGGLSNRLIDLYARELLMGGTPEDFDAARDYFEGLYQSGSLPEGILRSVYVVLAECALLSEDANNLLKYSIKDVASGGSSEMCCIMGAYFEKIGELSEAAMWYYNAGYETEPLLNIQTKERIPLRGLIRVYQTMGNEEMRCLYQNELDRLNKR